MIRAFFTRMTRHLGGNGGSRTLTEHRMKVLHYHYATLPYLNTLAGVEPANLALYRARLFPQHLRGLRIGVFRYGLGLSPTVTPVANVCGKERPYKLYGGTSEIRTRDQWIKSPLLYQLSYSPLFLVPLSGIEPKLPVPQTSVLSIIR